MLTTFRRFLPTPKKKPQKTPDKTTEKPHQTKSPAATPALRGAAFSQFRARFSRAGPGPWCRRPEQPRAGPAFPWRQRPRRRPRRLPPAAGRERPGPARPGPEIPPGGLSGEPGGKTSENVEIVGANLCFWPQRITQAQGRACKRGWASQCSPFQASSFPHPWWTGNNSFFFFQGEAGFPQDISVSLWKAQWWLPRSRSGKWWQHSSAVPGKGSVACLWATGSLRLQYSSFPSALQYSTLSRSRFYWSNTLIENSAICVSSKLLLLISGRTTLWSNWSETKIIIHSRISQFYYT